MVSSSVAVRCWGCWGTPPAWSSVQGQADLGVHAVHRGGQQHTGILAPHIARTPLPLSVALCSGGCLFSCLVPMGMLGLSDVYPNAALRGHRVS